MQAILVPGASVLANGGFLARFLTASLRRGVTLHAVPHAVLFWETKVKSSPSGTALAAGIKGGGGMPVRSVFLSLGGLATSWELAAGIICRLPRWLSGSWATPPAGRAAAPIA